MKISCKLTLAFSVVACLVPLTVYTSLPVIESRLTQAIQDKLTDQLNRSVESSKLPQTLNKDQLQNVMTLELMNQIKLAMFTPCAIYFGCAVALAFLVSRALVAHPIKHLAKAAVSIKNGDLNAVALVNSKDEIGHLSQCLYDMTGQLKSHIRELKKEVAQREQAEESLAQLNDDLIATVRELDRKNKDISEFTYLAAHDLKTPLRGMATLAQWLLVDYQDQLENPIKEQIELLKKRAFLGTRLVDGILEYSRAGRQQGKPRHVDLNELVMSVLNHDVPPQVEVCIDKSLPCVYTHEACIDFVFSELIKNAFKHHPQPEACRITVGWSEDQENWLFYVQDNGPGIALEHREKIFHFFQRLNPDSESQSVGIGLCIVKKILETRGTDIWLESQPPQGTTFFFTWPKQCHCNDVQERFSCALDQATERVS